MLKRNYFRHLNRRLTTTLLAIAVVSPTWAFTQVATRFSGKAVSIHMNGDIRDFFQSISSVSGIQLSVDASVKRNITVHVANIPWDQALDVVLRSSGLSSEFDGIVLRIAAANPVLGQDHVLMGTTTVEGKVTEFTLQNPRTVLQVNAPGPDGIMQPWRIEWESAANLLETGIKPNTLKVGDQVIITGNLTRANTLRLIIVRRPSDGFSWGGTNVFSPTLSDSVMFVSVSSN
jgi:hypothetical protein